jgi:aconitate hydratase
MNRTFGTQSRLETAGGVVTYYRLERLAELGLGDSSSLPFSIKVLLENTLRYAERGEGEVEDVLVLAQWKPKSEQSRPIAFRPARIIHQDYNGLAAMVDLAAMRSAVAQFGGNPEWINPVVPTDFVIDHSIQVDFYGSRDALERNIKLEIERNRERYVFLRWAQRAFQNFRLVPPGTGIVHQVNLEYLATVIQTRQEAAETEAFPDTLVGTDSHTPMINGIGVLGWGVGGIEAEVAMLGRPLYIQVPEVVGVRLTGELHPGVTATDLALTITQLLRQHNVVGKFVEFFGPGLDELSPADRATVANMAPEYGATIGFFPIDEVTLGYLRITGRDKALIDLVERYSKTQGLWRAPQAAEPTFSEVIELDLGSIEPSLAGPRRPQERIRLGAMKQAFAETLTSYRGRVEAIEPKVSDGTTTAVKRTARVAVGERIVAIEDGTVAIAAITSCTNTSNPSLMLGAGLLAKKAVERGLTVPPYVKTSLAPGSPVVADYLARTGLMPYLETLGFHVVGFGCTTCAGGSGPLPDPVALAVQEHDLLVAAVLSGNRNFEGRIHPLCKLAYLASPPLVVAYALAGTVDIDMEHEPLGRDRDGRPVYLRDLWPSKTEIQRAMAQAMDPALFRARFAELFKGDQQWQALEAPVGALYEWDEKSTYIQKPPFFENLTLEPAPPADIRDARVLVLLGDSITTDHISPAGSIPVDSPAGRYLIKQGVQPRDFNSYGARRGNREVMVRGTFGNPRLRNMLTPDKEGDWTIHLPSGEMMRIYDAAMRYRQERTPLLIIAGKEYGSGSSRDWAAKGIQLLGVKAVLAESYERIHRSNLIAMGVLPLQFEPGESYSKLGLTGREIFDIEGLTPELAPGQLVNVRALGPNGEERRFSMIARLDNAVEVEYYRHHGILPLVLREFMTRK